MRIVAGLHGRADQRLVADLAMAGADEFFLGYEPHYWSARFGYEFSPNRRYRAGSQIETPEQLKAVCAEAAAQGCPVSVTFNEHFVTPAAWGLGRRLLLEARDAGATAVVVADVAALKPVKEELSMAIHVSGDAGLYNAPGCELAFELGASRVIFPRELPPAEMRRTVAAAAGAGREFEAFIMGEPCVFDGARCFTEHGYGFSCDLCNDHTVKKLGTRGRSAVEPIAPAHERLLDSEQTREVWALGRCGLCAVPFLESAGITHLKIPGRASAALTATKLVKAMLEDRAAAPAQARALLGAPGLCSSGAFCYYPELSDG